MRCPVCRADNDEGPQCRRCRADLSLLFALEEQRRQTLERAAWLAVRGKFRQALAVAEGTDAYRHDEESQRLLAAVHLLRRDYRRAWECYTRLNAAAQDGN